MEMGTWSRKMEDCSWIGSFKKLRAADGNIFQQWYRFTIIYLSYKIQKSFESQEFYNIFGEQKLIWVSIYNSFKKSHFMLLLIYLAIKTIHIWLWNAAPDPNGVVT